MKVHRGDLQYLDRLRSGEVNLRRSCHLAGEELEQIQFLLGSRTGSDNGAAAAVHRAVNDYLGIQISELWRVP